MKKYYVTIDFEPMVIEVDIDGKFDMVKIMNEVSKLDDNGEIGYSDKWIGYVEDTEGNEVYAL